MNRDKTDLFLDQAFDMMSHKNNTFDETKKKFKIMGNSFQLYG